MNWWTDWLTVWLTSWPTNQQTNALIIDLYTLLTATVSLSIPAENHVIC